MIVKTSRTFVCNSIGHVAPGSRRGVQYPALQGVPIFDPRVPMAVFMFTLIVQ